jgi:hypothetical protein
MKSGFRVSPFALLFMSLKIANESKKGSRASPCMPARYRSGPARPAEGGQGSISSNRLILNSLSSAQDKTSEPLNHEHLNLSKHYYPIEQECQSESKCLNVKIIPLHTTSATWVLVLTCPPSLSPVCLARPWQAGRLRRGGRVWHLSFVAWHLCRLNETLSCFNSSL